MPSELQALREDPHHPQRAKQLAACSSRVLPAEGECPLCERRPPTGRTAAEPGGQRHPPGGYPTPGSGSRVSFQMFGSTMRDLQRAENSPGEWSWEDED